MSLNVNQNLAAVLDEENLAIQDTEYGNVEEEVKVNDDVGGNDAGFPQEHCTLVESLLDPFPSNNSGLFVGIAIQP